TAKLVVFVAYSLSKVSTHFVRHPTIGNWRLIKHVLSPPHSPADFVPLLILSLHLHVHSAFPIHRIKIGCNLVQHEQYATLLSTFSVFCPIVAIAAIRYGSFRVKEHYLQ